MKKSCIRFSSLKRGKNEISFPSFILDESYSPKFPLSKIDNIDVDVFANKLTDDFISLKIKITAKVHLFSAYSLKEFPYELKARDEIHITTNEDFQDSEDYTFFSGDNFELDEIVYSLISTNIPLKPMMPDEKVPSGGDSYRILSEDEYAKEKEEKGNPYFDKLDGLFDDDDE